MPIYSGSKPVRQIYVGNKMVRQVYLGSRLIWSAIQPDEVIFESSEAGDTQLKVPVSGVYEITCVGGGGGTVLGNGYGQYDRGGYFGSCSAAAGGSGGYGSARFRLNADQILSVSVGGIGTNQHVQVGESPSSGIDVQCTPGGTSKVMLNGGYLVQANGGGGGFAHVQAQNYYSSVSGGAGGSVLIDSTGTNVSQTNGNNGTASHAGWDYGVSVTGGASVYNGYGAASSGSCSPPFSYNFSTNTTGGYVRIKFISY